MKLLWLFVIIFIVAYIIFFFNNKKKRSSNTQKVQYSLPQPNPNVLMIRGFDFYISLRNKDKDKMLESIRNTVGNAGTVYDETTHAIVLWNEFIAPCDILEQLSRELQTEVIWLCFQKQVDAFGYEHWRNGILQRRLIYGCYVKERTWEHIDGTPEQWEESTFFDQQDLEKIFEYDKKSDPKFRMADDEIIKLRTVWEKKKLEVDETVPSINGLDVAEVVAHTYNLPGWQ